MERTIIAFAICAFSFGATAAEHAPRPEVEAYLTGPNMADPQPGDPKDRLIIDIAGDSAKKIFDAMPGPSRKLECGQPDENGMPTKTSGELECFMYREGEYYCAIGIKLDTGQPTGGTIC